MGLAAPWFLAGLLAVGLPVYLHLLRQHKNTPVPFASLMFFERRTQSSIKHRRLRYLLLLALRLALLVLLVLAFTNPFWMRKAAPGDSDRRLLVVVDESFSMKAGDRLTAARAEAAKILAGRGVNRKGQVAALGSRLRMLTEPVTDAAELRAAVESIRGTDASGSFGEFARAIRGLAQATGEPLEVHLVSDMQKTAMPSGFADLQLPAEVKLIPHTVGGKGANWAVERVSAPSAVADPKKIRIQATVAGYDSPAAKRSVALVVAGKTVASKEAALEANGRATVEFQSVDIPYGFSRCEIRIDAGDALAGDDRALFAMERSDPRRVLLVHEARDTRSPLYFKTAVAASAEAAFAVDAVTADQVSSTDPGRFAFVVLSDVVSLPGTFEQNLQKYVRAGGSVLIAMGPGSSRRPKVAVADVAITEAKYYSRGGERFAVVGDADPSYPVLRRAGRWEGVKFYYAVKMDPAGLRVVARLSDQTPLLLEKKLGEGRALLFASTFDNLANDLPVAPSFVAFAEQAARYLSGVEDKASARLVGSFLELRSAKEQTLSVEVIDPEGVRPLSLKDATTATTFVVDREGFYEVRRANGRHEMVAVNADRKESDLAAIPEDTLALWTGQGGDAKVAGAAGPGEPTERPYRLWWYVMVAAALVTLAESVLASRYLGVQREEA